MVPSFVFSHRKEVYNPKTFVLHAALLGQSFLHCPIFLTAASRRSLDRISVPVWPVILSDRLIIVALVGLYPHQLANDTQAHLLPDNSFDHCRMPCLVLCGISSRFQLLSPCNRQITHALLTSPPLSFHSLDRSLDPGNSVRLACVKHAASVRPEPGSNS